MSGVEPQATVVVVNYHGAGVLGRALDGIAAQTGVDEVETIVIDNASSDGSWAEAQQRPGVRLVRNARNVGFGTACNQGAALARGTYLAFLNFDSVPQPTWLAALIAVAEERPDAGAVMGLVLREDGTLNTAGNRLHFLGFSWSPVGGAPPTGAPFEVPLGSGASLLVPRDRFEDVGGFWEAMFLYCEDADLSWRLRLRGWTILACPAALSEHRYEFGRNPRKLFHLERGRLLMLGANYEARTLLALAPALLATELGLLAVAARNGWLREKLAAWVSVAATLPELARQRRRVQARRVLSDRELAPLLDTRLGPEFGSPGLVERVAPLLRGYRRLAGLGPGYDDPSPFDPASVRR